MELSTSGPLDVPRTTPDERLSRLQSVGERLTAARTSEDVVAVVLDEMAGAVGADAAALALVEADATTVRVVGARGYPEDVVRRWSSFDVSDETPMAAAIRDRSGVLLGSPGAIGGQFPALVPAVEAGGHRALAALPLEGDHSVIGCIGLSFDCERRFDDADRRFLESLALQCAVALDRSRAYEAEASARHVAEAATARLTFLAEASTVLASSLDFEETLSQVSDLVVPRLADWCAVYLAADGQISTVKVSHADPRRRDAALALQRHFRPRLDASRGVGAVIRTGTEAWVAEVDDQLLTAVAADPEHLAHLRTLGAASVIIVPLRAGGQVIGALSLVATGRRRFGPDDVVLARELAARASQAIANARLYQDRAHVARTLQATLLPPSLPKIPGLELASRFVAGGDGVEVGGDFYDVFPGGELDLRTWNVVIGDVRGKGVEAAALTGVARNTVRSAAVNERSPAVMLRHLNDVLLRARLLEEPAEDPDPRFCTVVVGAVTPRPGGASVDLAVAGHPLPFLLRADGTAEQVGMVGTLLGIVADPAIFDVHVELRSGDALVLYTDGVTERHAGGRFFEEDGLSSVLSRCAGFTAATVAERVETAVRAFGEDALRDDLAILVVRVPERPASTTSASTDLPAHPLSARRARRFVLTALDAFSLSGLDEVAELLTSEVVTNAVVHAHSGVRISVEGVTGGVRISVADSDPLIPSLRQPVDDAEHGRGLYLVDVLAARWGVEPGDAGKSVWFELRSGSARP